jgi:chitodextrinase
MMFLIKCNRFILVPPAPPSLALLSVTSTNVTLSLASSSDARTDLRGYIVRYRPTLGEWSKERLGRQTSKHTVTGLQCGTTYEFTAAAYNQVGLGNMGPLLETTTIGDKPIAPERSYAISSSLQTITVHLDQWIDSDCPISQFRIEQRSANHPWTTGRAIGYLLI